MATELITLKVQPRPTLGKKVRALRRHGLTPVHLYGKEVEPQALQVESSLLRRTLLKVGKTKPVSLEVEGKGAGEIAFVREIQFDPMTESLLHVDFLKVDVTQRMEAEVPVVLFGESLAVKNLGGSLNHVLHTILVECMPLEVPDSIRVDVSPLDTFEKAVRIADLAAPAGVKFLTSSDQVVAVVSPPRAEEVVEAAPAAAAEVEVIKAERPEGEEGEEEGEEKAGEEK